METEQERLWLLKTQLVNVALANSLAYNSLRLLPRFDIYLLSYRDRRRILAPELEHKIRPGGGILAATLLLDGCIAGTWSSKLRGKTLEVIVQPFASLPTSLLPLLEQEAQRVGRFLGYIANLQVI